MARWQQQAQPVGRRSCASLAHRWRREELLAAKAVIETVKVQMETERQPFNRDILVGAMIETPSAAIMIRRLAQEVDFFSIGTNDLIQYLLATDRTSSEVASYYAPLRPAVLQVLASLATTAKGRAKSISIRGEMAGNPAYTQLLLVLEMGTVREIKECLHAVQGGPCRTPQVDGPSGA